MPTKTRRRMHPIPPSLKDKTQAFVKTYVEAMKEVFPRQTEPQLPWNPHIPIYSVTIWVDYAQDTERRIMELSQVNSTVADKAAEFGRFLALELRPGEMLTIDVERHEDIPMNMAAPVIMAHPA